MIIVASVILLLFFLSINQRYRWVYILCKTLRRDISSMYCYIKLEYWLRRYERNGQTVAKVFAAFASRHPNKVAFYFEDQTWTFGQIERLSNQIAHFFKRGGLTRGDAAALLLENRPEYVAVWLGLSKIGVVTALINTNLVAESLVHSIKASEGKIIIFGDDYKKAIKDIGDKLIDTKLYQFNTKEADVLDGAVDLSRILKGQPDYSPIEDIEYGNPKDKLLFIYTSGTTGLPKAAIITNMRFLLMTLGLHYMTRLKQQDIIYNPLPLYHSAGGIVGVGQSLLRGIPVVIRKKFSASKFWDDCIKYNCTAAQYIGEICRYILVANSKNEKPITHKVTKMIGNGLRPQVWKQFADKFKVKKIYEFYGATEGNANLINTDNKVGAVGFIPRYATCIYPLTLIKYDETTDEPIRYSDGFCRACKPGEAGILVGIVDPKKSLNNFSGYADKKANEKKMLESVFRKGDLYFNTGDVLVQDEFGYYYFKDRTGDTFRWKGENVATSEIEAVISTIAGLNDVVVYGVGIPGNEGRAGMAAIVDTEDSLDIDRLAESFRNNLPSYAIPIFIRVMTSLEATGTFKLKKVDLRKEGFSVDEIKDKLFIYDTKKGTYVDLTKETYEEIMTGKMRL